MRADVAKGIRKKAEENGIKVYGRLRFDGRSGTFLTFQDDMNHRFLWSEEEENLTVLIFCK